MKTLEQIKEDLSQIENNPTIPISTVLQLCEELSVLISQNSLISFPNAIIACHRCKRIDAPQYSIKNMSGKYIVLCIDPTNPDGDCTSREVRKPCSYIDNMGIQCFNESEWDVSYSENGTIKSAVCKVHVGAVLGESKPHYIFPII